MTGITKIFSEKYQCNAFIHYLYVSQIRQNIGWLKAGWPPPITLDKIIAFSAFFCFETKAAYQIYYHETVNTFVLDCDCEIGMFDINNTLKMKLGLICMTIFLMRSDSDVPMDDMGNPSSANLFIILISCHLPIVNKIVFFLNSLFVSVLEFPATRVLINYNKQQSDDTILMKSQVSRSNKNSESLWCSLSRSRGQWNENQEMDILLNLWTFAKKTAKKRNYLLCGSKAQSLLNVTSFHWST